MSKTKEGRNHLERDTQFEHIAAMVLEFQSQGQPVVSVDAKNKELIGSFANKGLEWQPKGQPKEANVHDFPHNVGRVSVGIDHETAEFAVESLRRWWREMGKALYPGATRLLITADGGGSNGSRVRLWEVALQQFVSETGLQIGV